MASLSRLESLIIRYVRERRARGELTRETGQHYLSRLLDFAAAVGPVHPNDLKRRHVERWMERPDLRAHYRRARLTALRGFCQWCVIHRHIDRDPTLGIPLPPLPALLPRNLSTEESAALLVEVHGDPRLRLCCLLMVQECLRRGEVALIQLGDIDRAKRMLAIRGKGGQGEVTRRVPITGETWSALMGYIPTVGATSGPLIRSKRYPERGVSGSWIGELTRRAMTASGVKHFPNDGRSAHALRHTGAQDMVDEGKDIRKVQRVLGHASIATTQLYVRGSVHGLREVIDGRTYESPTSSSV